MPEPVGTDRRYLAGLDGLRAIAVLAVIAYHLNLGWAPGGLLGVGVFFVLSGYLITDLLLEQRARHGRIAVGQFWVRRARRLLPALWIVLAAVILWSALAQPAQLAGLRDQVVAALAYVSNWWYVFQHVSYFAAFGPPSPLGHLWSLAVEEQFYLVWPLLLLAGLRFINRRVLVALTLVGAAVSAALMAALAGPALDPSRVYYGTDTRAFQLLIGAALAFVWPSARLATRLAWPRRAALDIVGTLGLVVIGWMVWGTDQYQPVLYRGGMVVLSLAAAAAVATLAHPASLLGKVIGAVPLRWLGVRSYGIYLWHFPIIVLTTPIDGSGFDPGRGALQIAATLIIAAASWRWVEEPIRRLGFAGAITALAARRWSVARIPTDLVAVGTAAALTIALCSAAVAGAIPAPPPPAVAVQTMADISPPWHIVRQADDLCAGTGGEMGAAAAPTAALPPPPPPLAVTAVGDSIMIDTSPFLHALLPGVTVDGKVSRQMYQLPDVLGQLRAQGRLHRRLVIELGTNGPFDETRIVATLRSLGSLDRLVLVNTRVPRPWETKVNLMLEDVARQLPNATVADWHDASVGQAQYFAEDGVHPGASGARILANLIAQAVDPPPLPFAGQRAHPSGDCGSG